MSQVSIQQPGFELAQQRLRALISEHHGASLGAHDPLAITLTALLLMTDEAFARVRDAQEEALRAHRSELEQLTTRWSQDAQHIGDRILWRVSEACKAEAAEAAHGACRVAEVNIEHALQEHLRGLKHMKVVLAVAVVTAAVSFVGLFL